MIYILLAKNDPSDLSDEVTAHLNNGFELYGSPFSSSVSGERWYHYQAVIKK